MSELPKATLYRMILPEHTCPFGAYAKSLLDERGFDVDEYILRTRDEVEAVEEKFDVETTPVVLIGDELIGGSDDLAQYLGGG